MHLKKEKQTMVLPLKLNLKGRFQIFILGDSNGDLTRALISGKPVYIKKHTQQSISMLRKICKSIDPCNLVTKSWELLWQKKARLNPNRGNKMSSDGPNKKEGWHGHVTSRSW